ncbi:hypothetical protein [Methylotuvimicrobium sp. KM2]|uniref:hypothetical protein n=1 Tax=Methylotuvimicrobium sp. KM2 TaxID=3133976 RepID=UPI00310103DF
MKRLVLAAAIIFAPSLSWAVGEVLKLNTKGTEYCYGSKPLSFGPRNSMGFWVRIDDLYSATVYLDQSLTKEVGVLDIESSMISSKRASFSAFYGDTYDHFAAVGTFNFDATGSIKSLKATLIRRGILNGCYSRATVKGKRIN